MARRQDDSCWPQYSRSLTVTLLIFIFARSMRTSFASLLLTLLAIIPTPVIAAGLPPWQFGMTKSQVVSFKEFGPYKDFANGDAETFNGRFQGRKENIQFFFANKRLHRIGIYLWEGKDPKKGIPVWRRAYEILEKDYGKVTTPDAHVAPNSDPVSTDVLDIAGAVNADVTGKSTIAPIKQPRDMLVSAQFMRAFSREGKSFAIAIFLTQR